MGEIATFTASDGYPFHYRRYTPTGESRGQLVFVHGIRSHSGWYTRSCSRLAAAGFDVHFLDRRGAGLNTIARGDTPTYRRLLDDIAEYLQHLRATAPPKPTFLGGISWGGKLVVGLPYRAPGLVDGLVLLCPGLAPRITPPLGQRVRIVVARLFRPRKLFPIPLNEPELFTAHPQWQRFIETDPHGLRTATARFLFASYGLDWYLQRAAKRVTMPSFLALAEHDRIIDNVRTEQIVARFPGLKQVQKYAGTHHTLEFEEETHPWLSDVMHWLNNTMKASLDSYRRS